MQITLNFDDYQALVNENKALKQKVIQLDEAYEQFQYNVELNIAEQMREELSDLELANDNLIGEVQGLSIELEQANDRIFELVEALEHIQSITKGVL